MVGKVTTESNKKGIQKVIICKSHITFGRKFYGAGKIEILEIRIPRIPAISGTWLTQEVTSGLQSTPEMFKNVLS